ncbi:hypothetical protein HN51_056335 [Arachis hypogaea]
MRGSSDRRGRVGYGGGWALYLLFLLLRGFNGREEEGGGVQFRTAMTLPFNFFLVVPLLQRAKRTSPLFYPPSFVSVVLVPLQNLCDDEERSLIQY